MIRFASKDRFRHRQHERVIEAAEDCLRKSPYMHLKRVFCDYDEGVLFLRGNLPNYYLKQLAQEAVRGVDGVAQVRNEIEVARAVPPNGERREK